MNPGGEGQRFPPGVVVASGRAGKPPSPCMEFRTGMAHSPSSHKRIRQNAKRRAINRWRLRAMRDALREFADKLAHGSKDEASSAFRTACQVVDRSAQKGVIHRNQAARRKSRLSARLKAKA